MNYFAAFIDEEFDTDTIAVSVPALGIKVTGIKTKRPKGIDYTYNEFSTFDLTIEDKTIELIKKGNLRIIDAATYNITAAEHRQPTQRIDAKILKPITQMGAGIGETFILEMTKCADNLIDYFASIVAQGEAAAAKIPGAVQKQAVPASEQLRKKLQSAVRVCAAGVTKETFGSKAATEKPVLTVDDSDSATLHGSAGTGFHTDKRGSANQGQHSFSESSQKAPMGVLGIDAIEFSGRDILPKGNVLTPHVNKIPDILGLISLGIGVMNVFNVIRELWNIDAQWMQDMDGGFKKIQNDSFDFIKEMNKRVNGELDKQLEQRARTTKSTTERILELTAKIREDIEKEKAKQAEAEKQRQAAAQQVLNQVVAQAQAAAGKT